MVGQHHALGQTRGARGVQQQRHIIGLPGVAGVRAWHGGPPGVKVMTQGNDTPKVFTLAGGFRQQGQFARADDQHRRPRIGHDGADLRWR